MVKQRLKSLGLEFNARIDLGLFADLFDRRLSGEKIRVRRGMELSFRHPATPEESRIWKSIETFAQREVADAEKLLFTQKKRLADAERALATKHTKTAKKEVVVAQRQIARLFSKLQQLQSTDFTADTQRIFPFDWAPVIISRAGERVIVPMRYHLRPPGMKPDFDRKYPGCYNARRDSLNGFWKNQFGQNHGIIVLTSFFENVNRHDLEKRPLGAGEKEENVVIQFKPRGFDEMVIPIIWDHSPGHAPGQIPGHIDDPAFDSFALITDEPPPEVLATGHDRCPIFLKPSNIDAWLNPAGKSDAQLFALLDDKEKPFYEHAIDLAAG